MNICILNHSIIYKNSGNCQIHSNYWLSHSFSVVNLSIHACMYECIYLYLCECMHLYLCIKAYMYIYACTMYQIICISFIFKAGCVIQLYLYLSNIHIIIWSNSTHSQSSMSTTLGPHIYHSKSQLNDTNMHEHHLHIGFYLITA